MVGRKVFDGTDTSRHPPAGFESDTGYGKRVFYFQMTDHTDPCKFKPEVMEQISEWIIRNADWKVWQQNPVWSLIYFTTKYRVVMVQPYHQLFYLLDDESKKVEPPKFNYLSWKGNISKNKKLYVRHFGPFGIKKSKDIEDQCRKATDKFEKMLMALKLGVTSDLTEEQKERNAEKLRSNLRGNYLRAKSKLETQIGDAEKELNEIASSLGITELLSDLAKVGETIARTLIKRITVVLIAKEIAKEIAIISAKQAGKSGGKSAAKKVPLVGLAVGAGLGIWRLLEGDPGRAALEVASGAASMVPGAGTATSVAIDAAIAGIDITEKKTLLDAKKGRVECLQHWLERLVRDLSELRRAYQLMRVAKK